VRAWLAHAIRRGLAIEILGSLGGRGQGDEHQQGKERSHENLSTVPVNERFAIISRFVSHILSRCLLGLAGLLLVAAAPTPAAKPRKVIHLESDGCPGAIPRPSLIVVLAKTAREKTADSQLTPEGWFRAGERDFESVEPGALARAVGEYGHAAEAEGFANRPLAMYRLAWTQYRLDALDKAVDGFARLLSYCPKCGDRVAGNLREETRRFLAAVLADPEFGGMARASEFLKQQGSRPWVRAAWLSFADTLFDLTQFADAIAAYRQALLLDPLDPSAPRAQAAIVRAHERNRDPASAAAERKILLEKYAPGSAWHSRNSADVDALAEAKAILEKARPQPAVDDSPLSCNSSTLARPLQKLRDGAATCASPDVVVRKLSLHAIVAEDGRLRSTRVSESGPLADCLLGVARSWALAKQDQECVLDVTVVFAASDPSGATEPGKAN
jgi:tetratricopeptide (TPR) repeat protein